MHIGFSKALCLAKADKPNLRLRLVVVVSMELAHNHIVEVVMCTGSCILRARDPDVHEVLDENLKDKLRSGAFERHIAHVCGQSMCHANEKCLLYVIYNKQVIYQNSREASTAERHTLQKHARQSRCISIFPPQTPKIKASQE